MEFRVSAKQQQLDSIDSILDLLCTLLSVRFPSELDVGHLAFSSEPFQLTRELFQLLRLVNECKTGENPPRQEQMQRIIYILTRVTAVFQQSSSSAPLSTLFKQLFELIPSHLASLIESWGVADQSFTSYPGLNALISTVSPAFSPSLSMSPLAVHASSFAKFLLFQAILPTSVSVI